MATAMTELPNGRLVCTEHQLTVCGVCCVDYSFMDEILEEEQEGSDETEATGSVPKTSKSAKKPRNTKTAFSRNKMVKEHWGDRPTFQAAYGLKMTPDDIAEGNEILKAMEKADKQSKIQGRNE